jgi:hypothetical protein
MVLLYWLSLVGVFTFAAGLVYITAQQVIRLSGNDPQIQMAEDAAQSLSEGKNPQVPSSVIDMRSSLATYMIIFDDTGQPITSTVQLEGITPAVPSGVFGSVRQEGEKRFTWQPKTGVRSAAVVTHYGGTHSGFVLVGRSLREVEKREDQILQLVGVAWLCALVGSTLTAGGIFLIMLKLKLNRTSPPLFG